MPSFNVPLLPDSSNMPTKLIVVGLLTFVPLYVLNSILALVGLNQFGFFRDRNLHFLNGQANVIVNPGQRYYVFEIAPGSEPPRTRLAPIAVQPPGGEPTRYPAESVPVATFSMLSSTGQYSGTCIGKFLSERGGPMTITALGIPDRTPLVLKTSVMGDFLIIFFTASVALGAAICETCFIMRLVRKKLAYLWVHK